MTLIPGAPAPRLSLPLVDGRTTDDLEFGTGADGRFSLVVFYRGLHCPACRRQLAELDRRLDDLREAGVGRVVAVSMNDAERAATTVETWRIGALPVAHSLSEADARSWGLFISDAIKESEPARFNEPGAFLLDADGTVYWSSVASMPFSRPAVDDIISGVRWAQDQNYPARGAA